MAQSEMEDVDDAACFASPSSAAATTLSVNDDDASSAPFSVEKVSFGSHSPVQAHPHGHMTDDSCFE